MNEYQQPAHPMRITTSSTNYWCTHIVYAVRVDDRGLTYMTANGLTYTHLETAYAETLIAGEWLKMTTKDKPAPRND